MQMSLIAEACGDSHWPRPRGVPVGQMGGSRTGVRCERWCLSTRRLEVTHQHTRSWFTTFLSYVLKEGANWKQERGLPSSLGDTETERFFISGHCMSGNWASLRQRDRAEVAAWKRDVRAHSAVCSLSLADSSWHVGSSLVIRSSCAGGTCGPPHVNQGRGRQRDKGRAWFPSLSFPLTSGP